MKLLVFLLILTASMSALSCSEADITAPIEIHMKEITESGAKVVDFKVDLESIHITDQEGTFEGISYGQSVIEILFNYKIIYGNSNISYYNGFSAVSTETCEKVSVGSFFIRTQNEPI